MGFSCSENYNLEARITRWFRVFQPERCATAISDMNSTLSWLLCRSPGRKYQVSLEV
jgi:hypothetical protein